MGKYKNYCRECLICGRCHEYLADYLTCEMQSLAVIVLEVSDADMETLRAYLYPLGQPDVGVADRPETQR